jgi:dTDP-4-amino-4,6-dideoxygalactose transaminase
MATFACLGYNLRLSDIQAAVGVAQMAKVDRLLQERRKRAVRYSALLAGASEIVLPNQAGSLAGHTYQSYVVRIAGAGRQRRNDIMRQLAEQQIATRPGTHAVHRLGYYANKYGYKSDIFPNAVLCEDTTITLPLFPGMTDGDQDRVVDALCAAVRR